MVEQGEEQETNQKEDTPTDTEDDGDSIEDLVEDTPSTDDEKTTQPVPMKNVTTEEWLHLNNQPPLWQRYGLASVSEMQQYDLANQL